MLMTPWLFAQAEPLISRLDQPTRVKVLLALGSVVVLGIVMLFLIWLAGRAVRRYMSYEPHSKRATRTDHDDWARKPLVPPYQDSASPEEP
jgi:threonine/homoserine/homoserine lactone efflux protein